MHLLLLCLKIHFIIILPVTPGSSKWFLSLMFSHQKKTCMYLSSTAYVLRAPPILVISIWSPVFGEECRTDH